MFWLYKVVKMEASAEYLCHMNAEFGAGHLSQTVLPNTVSALYKIFSIIYFIKYNFKYPT